MIATTIGYFKCDLEDIIKSSIDSKDTFLITVYDFSYNNTLLDVLGGTINQMEENSDKMSEKTYDVFKDQTTKQSLRLAYKVRFTGRYIDYNYDLVKMTITLVADNENGLKWRQENIEVDYE